MTQLSTSISPIARGISALPDAASAATSSPQPQPTVSFPEPVAQSELAQIRSFMLDSAVHANRRNTDPAAAEKRAAPRYSLRELNSLTAEEITERMAQVNPSDDRPGWVKALDLIDLPRNFVGNTIADNFLPEAKRMALQRGEFDQAGLAKVYGADLLRAMGVENRAVNAIGGFFVDLFTDPLSWIGGPIGGAKTLGSRGIAEVSTTGRRTLNSAINSIRNGKAVADDVTRKMLDMHIADGIANGVLTEAATNAEKAAYIQSTARGKSGKLSAAAEKVGLGRFSRGGTLAEDLYRSSGNAKSATEAARIDSVKEWIAKYTTNPGIDLTKGAGGATIGHVPLTTRSLTIPSFKVPGIQHRFGGAQELQMAFAKAGAGKTAQAQLIASASKHATEVNNARRAMEGAFENLDAARLTDDADAIAQAQAALDDVVGNFQQLKQTGEMLRKGTAPSVMRANLNNINDIPTLVATMDALDDAMLDVRRAEALAGFRGMAPNPTPKDVAAAKTAREQAAADAKALGLIDKADEFFDSLADPSRVSEDLADFIAARTEAADNRWRSLFTGTDEDLTRASMLADTFSEGLATAQEIARRRLVQVRSVMNQDERLITEAARHMLGISDRDLGHLPLMSADRAFESLGRQAISTKMARLGEAIGTNLGGTGGTAKEMFRYHRTIVNGSGRRASEELAVYAREIEKLMMDADVPASQFNTMAELAGLMMEMEAVKLAAIDYPIMAGQMERGTKYGQKILAEAAQSGVLQNEPLRKGLQQIAADAAVRLREVGEIEIMQGNLESPLAVYVPNVLKKEAAKRARIARSKGDARAADLIQSHSGPADLDPTKRRVTNMIEFTDDAGNDHKFTIAEALAYASKSRATLDELSITYPQEAKNAERVLEGLQQFVGRFGKDDLSKVPPEELERMLRAESRPAFGSELNDYAADGRLDPLIGGVLTGGDDRRDIFDNNILNIMYSRLQAHEIARAKESFRDVVEPYIVFKVDAGESVATTQGGTAVLSTGEKAQVLGDGRIRVGNRNYVQIKDAISKFPENTLFDPDLLLGNIDGAYIPDTIAVQLKRLADTMNPQQIGPIMGAAENITSMFRTSTLLHPSWFGGNTVGNTFQAAMSGMFSDPKRAGQFMQAMKQSLQSVIRRNAEHVSSLDRAGRGVRAVSSKLGSEPNRSFILGGQQFRAGDLIDEAAVMDVIGQGRAADAQEQMHKMMESLIPSMREQTPQLGALGNVKSQVQREVGKMQAGRSSSTRLQRASDSVAAGYRTLPVGGLRRALRAWWQVNSMNDDVFRLAVYSMFRADGYDAVTAAQKTREGMLNFGDLTSFEQNHLRPLVPFYCVPEEYKALTRSGWKTCDELSEGDEMLTYNSDTDTLEWQVCNGVAVFEHDQELLALKSRSKEILCTPNHRWMTETRTSKTRGEKTAEQLTNQTRVIVSADLTDDEPDSIGVESARLLSWIVTDGYHRWRGNHLEAVVYQSPKKYLDIVKDVAGGKPRKPHPDTGVVCVPVLKERLTQDIRDILSDEQSNLLDAVCRMSRREAQAFYEAAYLAEGCISGGAENVAAQKDHVREAIRVAAFMCGRASCVNYCHGRPKGLYVGKHCERRRLVYGGVEKRHYKGRVWCPQTKNGTWVMSTGSQIMVTGNTWLRASFPAYAVKSIKDPKQLAAVPKIRQGLEELTAGENRLPQHMRPRWLQETMAIQIGTDPETRGALIAGTLIPQEGVITALQPITSGFDGADLSDVINWAMSQTSPAFRVPFELATKREVFSGRDIGFTPGEGDISLRDYMLSQVRPIKEFGLGVQQGKVAQDFEKSPALGVSRALIGGRFQSGLAEQKRVQTLYYEMSDQIEDLRRAVRRAEDAGNDDQAAKFKFDILATYKRYVDKGVALESIPKWAREDLAAFGPGE